MKKISKLLFLFALLACSVNLQAQLAVPYSEVPSFSTVYAFNSIVLTGDLQSFNITNGSTSGQVFAVKACQDTQGGHVIVSGPNNFAGNLTIDKTPNACTTFNFTWNGIYWVGAGSPSAPIVYPHPSGQYADLGVPTFTCVSPCTYTRLDAPQGDNPFYTLIATAKTISTNWVELGGGSSGGSGPSQVNVTFTADGDCDLTNPINCTLTTSTGGAAGPDSPYAASLYVQDPGNVLTTTRQIFAPPSPGRIYTVLNNTNQPVGLDTLEDGGNQVVESDQNQTFVGIIDPTGVVVPYYDFSSESTGGGDAIPTTPNNALVKIDGAGGAASELTDDGTTLNYSGTNFVMHGAGDNQQITGDNVYSWVVQSYGYCNADWMWCVSTGVAGSGPHGTNYIDGSGNIHLGHLGNVYLDDLTSEPCLGTDSSGLLGAGTGCDASVPVYTVSTLPAATSLPPGTMVEVSDTVGVSYSSTSFTQTTCTGGGTNYAIAITDGTNWSCH
jgi:hypothetical protein